MKWKNSTNGPENKTTTYDTNSLTYQAGRGLVSFDNSIDESIRRLHEYNYMKRVKKHKSDATKNTQRSTKQNYKEKQLYGDFKRQKIEMS